MSQFILDDTDLMLPPSFRRRRHYHHQTTTIEPPTYHSPSMPHPYSSHDSRPLTPPRSPIILHEDRVHSETIIPRDALPPGVQIVSRDEVLGRREKKYHRSEAGSIREERMREDMIREQRMREREIEECEREREYSMSGAYRDAPVPRSELEYERERPADFRDVPAHPDGDRVYFDYRHNRDGEEPHRVVETGIGGRHHRVSGNMVSDAEHHGTRRRVAEAAGLGGAAGLVGKRVRRGRGERSEYAHSRSSSRSSSSSPDRHRGRKIAAGVVGGAAALGLAAAAVNHVRNRSRSRDSLVYSSDELDERGRVIGPGRRASSRQRSHSRAKKLAAATALGAGIAAARRRSRSRGRSASVSSFSSSDTDRSRSRSGSRHRGRKVAAGLAATGVGLAAANHMRKRSKSRAGSRSSSTSSFTSSSDDEKHPSHRGRKVAAAALGAATAGAAIRHHRKKEREEEIEDLERGRSRSRSADGHGPKSILRKVRSLSMGGKSRRRSGSVDSYTSDSSYSSDDSRRSRRSRRSRKPLKRQSTAAKIGKGIAVGVAAKALKNAFDDHQQRKYDYDSDDSRSSRRSRGSRRSVRRSRPGMGGRVRSRSLGGAGWGRRIAANVAASAIEHLADGGRGQGHDEEDIKSHKHKHSRRDRRDYADEPRAHRHSNSRRDNLNHRSSRHHNPTSPHSLPRRHRKHRHRHHTPSPSPSRSSLSSTESRARFADPIIQPSPHHSAPSSRSSTPRPILALEAPPPRPNSRAATVESDSDSDADHMSPTTPSPNTDQIEPPPMQYHPPADPSSSYIPYRKPEDPTPVNHGTRRPSFLARLAGPPASASKEKMAAGGETRPPRYHPDRDYINEFAPGGNANGGRGKRHDEEWLKGFLENVAGGR